MNKKLVLVVLVVLLAAGVVLGLSSCAGVPAATSTLPAGKSALPAGYAVAEVKDGKQYVSIDVQPSSYTPIVVQAGIPVSFDLKASEQNLTGCNSAIIIPAYDIQKQLQPGDNIVEFTPDKAGTVAYSCWMSMIRSRILVVDDLAQYTAAQ
jgi:uncharacterized protein